MYALKICRVAHQGVINGVRPAPLTYVQSKVGIGFNPKPVKVPMITANFTFVGDIQVGQLKYVMNGSKNAVTKNQQKLAKVA